MPSNVENGLGFVGGVATRTIPFHKCDVVIPAADRTRSCEYTYDASSASIAGRVLRPACGPPQLFANIQLVEKFADGHSVVRRWKSGGEGEYRFEGIQPGTQLTLEIPGGPSLALPTLSPGQRYPLRDLSASGPC
jgi:hypothetical protein